MMARRLIVALTALLLPAAMLCCAPRPDFFCVDGQQEQIPFFRVDYGAELPAGVVAFSPQEAVPVVSPGLLIDLQGVRQGEYAELILLINEEERIVRTAPLPFDAAWCTQAVRLPPGTALAGIRWYGTVYASAPRGSDAERAPAIQGMALGVPQRRFEAPNQDRRMYLSDDLLASAPEQILFPGDTEGVGGRMSMIFRLPGSGVSRDWILDIVLEGEPVAAEQDEGSADGRFILRVGAGGVTRSYSILPIPGQNRISFRGAISGLIPESLYLETQQGVTVAALAVRQAEILAPQVSGTAQLPELERVKAMDADPAEVLQLPRDIWRNTQLEVFRWSRFPEIIILDFADYSLQSSLFKRLAFYLEKRGYRGTIHPLAALEGLHDWNAHNYSAAGLADFFGRAAREGDHLSAEEAWLLRFCLDQGLLKEHAGVIEPGAGGLISITRESAPALRTLLLNHEAFHGIYYALPELRQAAERLWDALPHDIRGLITGYFDMYRYDIEDRSLMINEFQAYLLQQPLSQVRGFVGLMVSRLAARKSGAERRAVEALTGRAAEVLEANARELESIVREASGLSAGDVRGISEIVH